MATFRPAVAGDLDALLTLMRSFYAEEEYAFDAVAARRALDELLGDPALGRVWLLTDGAVAVGYVVLTFGYSLEHRGRDAFIDELYISPSHRRLGLGSAGLALAENACEELGVGVLLLEVERDKEAAQAMYRRAGFDQGGRYLMTKRLRAPPGPGR